MFVSLHYKYKLVEIMCSLSYWGQMAYTSLRSGPECGLSQPSPSPSFSSSPFPPHPKHLSFFCDMWIVGSSRHLRSLICIFVFHKVEVSHCFNYLSIFYYLTFVCWFQFPGSMISSFAREPHVWLGFPGTCFPLVWMSRQSRFPNHFIATLGVDEPSKQIS